MNAPALDQLLHAACRPYRQAGRFARYFARGKLGGDPAFRRILQLGLFPAEARILDIGCGQGLLAAWLLAAQEQHARGKWPSGWPAPPRVRHIHGIELMPRDVERARHALREHTGRATFEAANMCHASLSACEAVVILDVLHYVDFPAQDELLGRVYECLTPGGVLLLRVGDAAGGLPFKISNWVDNVVTFVRGHRTPPRYCRTLSDWKTALQNVGFQVEAIPMNEGTPFANIMLVCRKGGIMEKIIDHAWIEAHIPHQGNMCLLERVTNWDDSGLTCLAMSHRDPANPLRSHGRLGAATGIEYAAQAMAVHGALLACRDADAAAGPKAGFLASVRGARLHVDRLDDVAGALQVSVQRIHSEGNTILYQFNVASEAGNPLLAGRAAVIVDAALAAPQQQP